MKQLTKEQQEYKEAQQKQFKETIRWIKSGDKFVGKAVNFRCCTQADSIEELEKRIFAMCKINLKFSEEMIRDGFRFIEETDTDIWLYGEEEVDMRKQLARYKELYGELNYD